MVDAKYSNHGSGYDQGIMGSIIATPYFLEAVNIDVSFQEIEMSKC